MTEQDGVLYEAFQSKDSRFDGRFFVGVASTGIYCRPVCRARLPKKENCTFYHTAAEAEKAGYRPCLLCRPELAPGLSSNDAKAELAKRAAEYMKENCKDSENFDVIAAHLGCTARHLRRVFQEAYHVTPVQYLQTCRLLLAKSLLTDTGLSVTDAAMASGFGSLRRFNDLFQKRYHLSPSGFRKKVKTGAAAPRTLTVALGYRPPYAWDKILHFLSLRAIIGVEVVENGVYMRTVRMAYNESKEAFGWISVSNNADKNVLEVTLSDSLLPVFPQVLGRVRALFDLDCEPYAVIEKLRADPVFADFPSGLRVPGCFDRFELCVRTILGQQITVRAAGILAGKMAKAFGTKIQTGISGLEYVFPSAKEIVQRVQENENCFGEIGIISARGHAIAELARQMEEKEIDFVFYNDIKREKMKLMCMRGIGPWTAEYIAMRVLGDTDAFPETDLAIRKALQNKTAKEVHILSEQWQPWRSYATVALWDKEMEKNK